jgi:hypothetical protein
MFFLTCLDPSSATAVVPEEITSAVSSGHWQQASNLISSALDSPSLSATARQEILFQQERMRRIGLDFEKTKTEILNDARKIVPDITASDLDQWESEGAVESLVIDGQRRYFNRAGANVLRLHPQARELKAAVHPGMEPDVACWMTNAMDLLNSAGKPSAKRFRVHYTLTVDPDAVPPGEVIRAWLPYPHRTPPQTNVELIASTPANPILSPTANALSCLYLEQPASKHQPSIFKATFEFTTRPNLPPTIQKPSTPAPQASPSDLLQALRQQPPHIIFTPGLQKLSTSIIEDEADHSCIARKLFCWVSQNIPWAGAREYSTLESLTDYAIANRHGDCGIQTMLFITLCRLNGIPARWESGWITSPSPNLHDWCRIYLPDQGWITVDVSYGLMPSEASDVRLFYFGGLDDGRMVVNTDHEQPLHPAKKFFRSEIVDFQRGEVEWRGGNLYFDQWDYDFQVTEVPLSSN